MRGISLGRALHPTARVVERAGHRLKESAPSVRNLQSEQLPTTIPVGVRIIRSVVLVVYGRAKLRVQPTVEARERQRRAGNMSATARTDDPLELVEVERLVKSAQRVRDLGEVFTPTAVVSDMLDLLPEEIWRPHPSATFLEPAAGDGNFLVVILARKLAAVSKAHEGEGLPFGSGSEALEFHGLEALSSIYAVDISVDNIIGGTPEHPFGARTRLIEVFRDWYEQATGTPLTTRSVLLSTATWIVERNILIANLLPFNADGSPNRRDLLPLVEYRWLPRDGRVEVLTTTLGDAMDGGTSEEAALTFDFSVPDAVVWSGPARDIRKAPVDAPPDFTGPARNGNGVAADD